MKTIVYYDSPQLFIAQDRVGTKFICLLAERCSDYDVYLCVRISENRLESFLKGRMDLLSIYQKPEIDEFYCAKTDNLNVEISVALIEYDDIPQAWFPESGFYMEPLEDAENVITAEAVERRKATIHFGINTPETRDELKISANHLVEGLGIFQKLIKHAFKKAVSQYSPETRNLLDSEANYGIEVFSFSHGSFTIHLQSESSIDMFGYVDIQKALRKIDEIIYLTTINDETIDILRKNRGHFLSAYKQLLAYIIENDSPIYYEWFTPEITNPVKRSISTETATEFYDLIIKEQELTSERIELIGRVTQASTNNGTWTIRSEEDGKEYRGSISSGISLSGITLDTRLYKFTCEETIDEFIVLGKEKRRLVLIDIQNLG